METRFNTIMCASSFKINEDASIDELVSSAAKIAKNKDIKNPASFISNMCKKAKAMKNGSGDFKSKLKARLKGSMKDAEIEKLMKAIKC